MRDRTIDRLIVNGYTLQRLSEKMDDRRISKLQARFRGYRERKLHLERVEKNLGG